MLLMPTEHEQYHRKGKYKVLNKLNTKLAEIRSQIERTKANLNALVGAEQMLLQLIEEETNTESEVSENATLDD